MKAALLYALGFCLLGGRGFAEDAVSPWQVRADFLRVRLPQARALALVPRLLEEKSAVAAYAEIQKGIDAGEFRLLAELSGHTLSGVHGLAAGVTEQQPYALEFDQEDDRISSPAKAARASRQAPSIAYPAIAFEKRDLTRSFEFDPVVTASGRLVDLSYASSWVELDRWLRYETTVRADGVTLYAPQPIFTQRRVQTCLLCKPGIPQLLALYQIPGPTPTTELHLVTLHLRDLVGFPGFPKTPAMPDAPAPQIDSWQLRAEFHRFRLSQKDALLLRPQLQDEQRAEQAFARLLEWTAQGRASLTEWQNWPARSGSRGVCENILELRFPTEFEQPEIPQHFGNEVPTKHGNSIDPPEAFDAQNVGTTSELEPLVEQQGAHVSANLAFTSKEFLGFSRHEFSPFEGRTVYKYKPKFDARSTQTNIAPKNGARVLLSFAKLPAELAEKNREIEIVLLRFSARDLFAP